MAKFTVYFKVKVIQSHFFDKGVIHIGRDETNDIVIDSLAVPLVHTVVIIKEISSVIRQLNNELPLFINHERYKETLLQNNDVISIEKHTIIFRTTESNSYFQENNSENIDIESLNKKLEDKADNLNANIQVMDGPHIGRIFSLKKPKTLFGNIDSGVVAILKQNDGYFISTEEAKSNITINQQPLGDETINLNNNDIIKIDTFSMQFFLEK